MRRIEFGCSVTRAATVVPREGLTHSVRDDGRPVRRQLVLTPYDHLDWNKVKENALESERLGYDSVGISDHFVPPERFEAWTTIAALGALTSKIRISQHVLCVFFRGNPAVFARQVATLDVITGGRLNLGLGAGYNQTEFEAYGIPFPKPGVRIQMLKEYVEILKRMWTEKRVTYQGKFYTVRDAECGPKPLQPHIPITIGGRKPKILRVAAEHADWVNVFNITLEEYREVIKILEEQCHIVGRDPKEIGLSWGEWLVLLPNRQEVERLKEKLETSPQTWHGTPQEYVERLRKFVDIGITEIGPAFMDQPDMTTMRLFAKEVIPAFRTQRTTSAE